MKELQGAIIIGSVFPAFLGYSGLMRILVKKSRRLYTSIPGILVAALLCVMWGMLTALGLSNLRYSEAGSSRNIIIMGLSLFSLSIPAYFQQYNVSPNSNLPVPSYFQPYIWPHTNEFWRGNFLHPPPSLLRLFINWCCAVELRFECIALNPHGTR